MKVALPVWNERVSPVFDTAQRFLIVEIDNGEEVSRESVVAPGVHFYEKARRLRDAGVEVLICGAISNHAASVVCAHGIRLIPWVSGGVDEIVGSFLGGSLTDERFAMPGCRRRMGRGMRGRWRHPAGRMGKFGRGPGKR